MVHIPHRGRALTKIQRVADRALRSAVAGDVAERGRDRSLAVDVDRPARLTVLGIEDAHAALVVDRDELLGSIAGEIRDDGCGIPDRRMLLGSPPRRRRRRTPLRRALR